MRPELRPDMKHVQVKPKPIGPDLMRIYSNPIFFRLGWIRYLIYPHPLAKLTRIKVHRAAELAHDRKLPSQRLSRALLLVLESFLLQNICVINSTIEEGKSYCSVPARQLAIIIFKMYQPVILQIRQLGLLSKKQIKIFLLL